MSKIDRFENSEFESLGQYLAYYVIPDRLIFDTILDIGVQEGPLVNIENLDWMDGSVVPFLGYRASSSGKRNLRHSDTDPHNTYVVGYAEYLRFIGNTNDRSNMPQKTWMNSDDAELYHNLFEYVQENMHEQGLIWSSVYTTGRLAWLFRASQIKVYDKGIETLDGWGVFTFFRKW